MKKQKIIAARIDEEMRKQIRAIVKKSGETEAVFVRAAIRAKLDRALSEGQK